MTVGELQAEARRIWGEQPMGPRAIAVAMGVVYGDICREARDRRLAEQMRKELGNMIFSTIRWCGDLGFDPEECIRLAIQCQKEFVSKHGIR